MLIPHPAAAQNPPIPNHSNTSPSPPPHPALLLPTCAPQNLYFPAHPGLGPAQSTHQAPAALSGGQLCSLSPSAERGVPGDGRAVSAASRPTVLEPPASLRRGSCPALHTNGRGHRQKMRSAEFLCYFFFFLLIFVKLFVCLALNRLFCCGSIGLVARQVCHCTSLTLTLLPRWMIMSAS